MMSSQKCQLLCLLTSMACSRTSVDDAPRLVAADSFLDAAHNCEVLEILSESMCGDETYPVYCQWGDETFGVTILSLTQYPANTCDDVLSAAREQADADNLRCGVSNSDGDFPPFCEDQDTGISYDCERMLYCQAR